MDDDHLGCCGGCCLLSCICAADAICNRYTFLVALVLAAALMAAFGIALPVRATVTDASLTRLDLATVNGTSTSTAATPVAYNLSLTVVLRNRNWALRVEATAPLDAELRFAEEFRVLAASPSPGGVALPAAELARQHAEGVFEMELRVAGEVRYRPVHAGRGLRLEATCPVRMLMPNAPRGTHTHLLVLQKDVRCH